MEPNVRNGGNPTRERSGERGFTLMEVLIVATILGIIAMILTMNIGNVLKKQRLETAAEQVNSFLRMAQVASAGNSQGAFVVIAPNGDGSHTLWMVADTDANSALGFDPANPTAGPDLPVPQRDQLILTQDIVIHPEQAIPGGVNNWPVVGGNFVLLCDPRGLPFNPSVAPALPFTGPVRLSMTHAEMLTGGLHPYFRFDITVSPLWHSTLDRVGY